MARVLYFVVVDPAGVVARETTRLDEALKAKREVRGAILHDWRDAAGRDVVRLERAEA